MKVQLDKIKIASPCPVNWSDMSGDDLVRHCQQCNLKVYNISNLTRREAEELINSTTGRICGRIYKRTDGTIITKDCPSRLKAIKAKINSVAKAVLTAVLSITFYIPNSYAQENRSADSCSIKKPQIEKCDVEEQSFGTTISGVVLDPLDAIIAGAEITIINQSNKQTKKVTTDENGKYRILLFSAGIYTIIIDTPGFRKFEQKQINLGSKEELVLNVRLDPEEVTVGIILTDEDNDQLDKLINRMPENTPTNNRRRAK